MRKEIKTGEKHRYIPSGTVIELVRRFNSKGRETIPAYKIVTPAKNSEFWHSSKAIGDTWGSYHDTQQGFINFPDSWERVAA